jgi:chemotaxis protein CheD
MIKDVTSVLVTMGEMAVSSDENTVLTCLGLGSCIGLAVYDSVSRVGGLAHIVLPSSVGSNPGGPGKYADTAVPGVIEEMLALGANRRTLVARIVGGAQMSMSKGLSDVFKTGQRNAEATIEALAASTMRLKAKDIGGHNGRSMRLFVSTGKLTVSVGGGQTLEI